MRLLEDQVILLAHGDGGQLTHRLIEEVFLAYLDNPVLADLSDAAVVEASLEGRLALTTDCFVVSPLFFKGGDIGKLAVSGTVNDLVVSGARPLYLTAGFILEEGLELSILKRVVASLAATARQAGVTVVAGDTKVVGRGQADGLYINTTGLGIIPAGRHLGYDRILPGDRVVVSGYVGDHGLAVLAERKELGILEAPSSDCAPLADLVLPLLETFPGIRMLRDPTRGGLATTLKEIALGAKVDIWLDEEAIPVRPQCRALAEMLGLDPLYLANEGKFVAVVAKDQAEALAKATARHPLGEAAAVIGEVRAGEGRLLLRTAYGGTRRLEMLAGAPLPRIC
ncbi:MAG: hydrogenase expression/formation protein HypE [Moorellales bacterium]